MVKKKIRSHDEGEKPIDADEEEKAISTDEEEEAIITGRGRARKKQRNALQDEEEETAMKSREEISVARRIRKGKELEIPVPTGTRRPQTRASILRQGPATPSVFVGPSPTPVPPLLLAHRPIYAAADLRSDRFDRGKNPYKWVRVHACNNNKDMMMKITVTAMVGDVDQSLSKHLGSSCWILSLRIAKWLLMHPDYSVPSTHNLNKILLEVEEEVRMGKLPKNMLKMEEAIPDVISGINFEMEIQAILRWGSSSASQEEAAYNTLSPKTGRRLYFGSFDEMWDTHIASRTNAVLIVNRNDHFVVLRIDMHRRFWVINTIGKLLSRELDRAFILAFGSGTIFTTEDAHDQHHHLVYGLSSAEACRKYFRDYLGSDLNSLSIDSEDKYYTSQFSFYLLHLTS